MHVAFAGLQMSRTLSSKDASYTVSRATNSFFPLSGVHLVSSPRLLSSSCSCATVSLGMAAVIASSVSMSVSGTELPPNPCSAC